LKYLKKGEGYRAVVWFPETDRNDLPLYLQPPPAFVEDMPCPDCLTPCITAADSEPEQRVVDVGHWYADGSMVMSQGSDEDGNLNVADCWDEAVAQRIVALHNAAPPPHTAAPDTLAANARDAARYRFLRDNCCRQWESVMGGVDTLDIDFNAPGHDVDAAIDAAMFNQADAREGGE
jgi:hypothetical protein